MDTEGTITVFNLVFVLVLNELVCVFFFSFPLNCVQWVFNLINQQRVVCCVWGRMNHLLILFQLVS